MRSLMLFLATCMITLFAQTASAANFASLLYASNNVSSASYVTIVASSPIYVSKLQLCDTSATSTIGVVGMKLAVGSAGHEVDLFSMPYAGCQVVPLTPILPAGTRLSLKAITNTSATSGFATVSFLP